jgi:hypothetical protein
VIPIPKNTPDGIWSGRFNRYRILRRRSREVTTREEVTDIDKKSEETKIISSFRSSHAYCVKNPNGIAWAYLSDPYYHWGSLPCPEFEHIYQRSVLFSSSD